MKILIIDRDETAATALGEAIYAAGYEVDYEPDYDTAMPRIASDEYNAVFYDPAPLEEYRQEFQNLRRATRNNLYMTITGKGLPAREVLLSGANDILTKPYNTDLLPSRLENIKRLQKLVRDMGNTAEDFPSAGGVISKSAFNQLFLSCLDRASRYAERSYALFMGIDNVKQIQMIHGSHVADFAAARLARHLVELRRQSDIIAQTGKAEHALLLQRPIFETEPMEAANRFAAALKDLSDFTDIDGAPVDIRVELVELPSGAIPVRHDFTCTSGKSHIAEEE